MKKLLAALLCVCLLLSGCGSVAVSVRPTLVGEGDMDMISSASFFEVLPQPFRLVIRDIRCVNGEAFRLEQTYNWESPKTVPVDGESRYRCTATLNASKNLLPTLSVEVDEESRTITVSGDPTVRYDVNAMRFTCTYPLSELELREAMTVASCQLSGSAVELKLLGAATGTVLFNADSARCEIDGAANLYLAGKADSASLTVNGAATLRAAELLCRNTALEINGAAKCQIYADEKLQVVIRGTGTVHYFGNPETVDKTILGLGHISDADAKN